MTYLNNLISLNKFLLSNNNSYVSNYFFGKYVVDFIGDKNDQKTKFLRIKEKCNDGIFGTTLFGSVKPIGGIDLVGLDTEVPSIPFYLINDKRFADSYNCMYGLPISDNDSKMIKNILFNFVIEECKKLKKNKIQFDVHNNLRGV